MRSSEIDQAGSDPAAPGWRGARSPVEATADPVASLERPRKALILRAEFWTALLALSMVLLEADEPYLQSLFVWGAVTDMTFKVEPGASPAIWFPQSGPYDQRLGYVALPYLVKRLTNRSLEIESQARLSPARLKFIGTGVYETTDEPFTEVIPFTYDVGTPAVVR